jgi:hypothetical protein
MKMIDVPSSVNVPSVARSVIRTAALLGANPVPATRTSSPSVIALGVKKNCGEAMAVSRPVVLIVRSPLAAVHHVLRH